MIFGLTKQEIKYMNKKIDKYYTIDSVFFDYFNRTYWNSRIKTKYELDKIDGYINIASYLLDNIDLLSRDASISNFQ